MPTPTLLLHATSLVGDGAARSGGDDDVIDGICPQIVAEPPTGEAASKLLEWASVEGLATFIRGGGTKLGWGGVPTSIDLVVSTARMASVVAHRDGDLTATVEAGATLGQVNAVLAAHRQWLPIDPPWPGRATIGGIIATNDSGPSRHRHGAPRDVIIGVTIARPDGQLSKAGGIVVKNVAGYDLSRLMTGAFGALGVVISATFKLAPVAPSSRTVMIELGSVEAAAPLVACLVSSALTPTAIEAEWPPSRLLVRFESVESAVKQQSEEAARLAVSADPSCSVTAHRGAEEAALWAAHAARWDERGTLVKLSTVIDQLFPTLSWFRDTCRSRNVQMSAHGRAGLGVVDVRLDGAVGDQVDLIEQLRGRFRVGHGSAVIRRGSAELRRSIDPWGPVGDGLAVMQIIKQRFDPGGTLNPGRGPARPAYS